MRKGNQLKSCCKKMLSSRQAVGRDLPHPALLNKEEKQPRFMREAEDPAQKPCGMTSLFNNGNNGFTLIELLVVVLIIGILAAVALPQYQKAVWKSRYVNAKIMARKIADAEEVYYLANGAYTDDYTQLSLDLPTKWVDNNNHMVGFSWGNCTMGADPATRRAQVRCSLVNNGNDYLTYYIDYLNSSYSHGQTFCLASGVSGKPAASDINYQICKSDTNDPYPVSWGDNTYGWDY